VYWLGPKAFQLGKAFENGFDMSLALQPVRNRLTRETGESSSVYVQDGEWPVCPLRAEPNRSVRVAIRQGARLTMNGTATSIVLTHYASKRSDECGTLSPEDIVATEGIGDPLLASISMPLFGPSDIFVGKMTLAGVNGHFDVNGEQFRRLLFDEAIAASKLLGATRSTLSASM
jgi:DNA-binding IclR family transcriptional regulator